jgi:hypothetical protein
VKFITESIYLHGRGNMPNILNRFLLELPGYAQAIILAIFFMELNIMAADKVFICEERLCMYVMKVSALKLTLGNSIFFFSQCENKCRMLLDDFIFSVHFQSFR